MPTAATTSLTVETKVYEGQKPGTSGLRKAVKIFQQEHYTENFIQAILEALDDQLPGSTLVVGGDGRYYGKEATEKIIRISAANRVRRLIVGQNGILSTPAVSTIIRKYKTQGGIVLTASHNPGGPDADFGIKFNCENGGPAPDAVTNKIYKITTLLKNYKTIPQIDIDIHKIQSTTIQVDGNPFTVDVIDSVNDYLEHMKSIFDFSSIKKLLQGTPERPAFKVLINGMNGVTGSYIKRIFINELGVDDSSIINAIPLEDFGGLHPDPNLTYASELVTVIKNGPYDFGAAFDGDGDRNMILGRKAFFVTPSDSLAVLAANLNAIPYFVKTGIKGFARSMPTGAAVDRVAAKCGIPIFEVPTGWKYFGNLMDAGRLSLCGEESFGTGSDHIREKDGVWACLAWLSVVAKLGKSIEDILLDHWKTYGRNFFTRYDYENCDAESANKMMQHIEGTIQKSDFIGTKLTFGDKAYIVKLADNYSYVDPIDGSKATKQGLRILFEDGSRVIYRLSGTGSSGATIRLYIDSYEDDPSAYEKDAQLVLKPLVNIALDITESEEDTRGPELTQTPITFFGRIAGWYPGRLALSDSTLESSTVTRKRLDFQKSGKFLEELVSSKRDNEDEETYDIRAVKLKNDDRPYPMKLSCSGTNLNPEFKIQDRLTPTSRNEDCDWSTETWNLCSPCRFDSQESPGYDARTPLARAFSFSRINDNQETGGRNVATFENHEFCVDARKVDRNDRASFGNTKFCLFEKCEEPLTIDGPRLNPSKRRKADIANSSANIDDSSNANIGQGSKLWFSDNRRGKTVASKESRNLGPESSAGEYNKEKESDRSRRMTRSNVATATLGFRIEAKPRLLADKRMLVEINCDRQDEGRNVNGNILLKTELKIDANSTRVARFFENISTSCSRHGANGNAENVATLDKVWADSKFPWTFSARQYRVPNLSLKPKQNATRDDETSTDPNFIQSFSTERYALPDSNLRLKQNAANADKISLNTKLTQISSPQCEESNFIRNLPTHYARRNVSSESLHDATAKDRKALTTLELFENPTNKWTRNRMNFRDAVLSRHSNPMPKRLTNPLYIRNSLGPYNNENIDEDTLLESILQRCKDIPYIFHPRRRSRTSNASAVSYDGKEKAPGSKDKIIGLRKTVLGIANRLAEISSCSDNVRVPSNAISKSTLVVRDNKIRKQTSSQVSDIVETSKRVQDDPMYTYNPFQAEHLNRVKRSNYK
ncbi:hypothetical protein KM043_006181 [Ampulex compressa]|nr:hypothetical protein KM043_006181 [Ampulex compressa]